jgi:hypothetical protein
MVCAGGVLSSQYLDSISSGASSQLDKLVSRDGQSSNLSSAAKRKIHVS